MITYKNEQHYTLYASFVMKCRFIVLFQPLLSHDHQHNKEAAKCSMLRFFRCTECKYHKVYRFLLKKINLANFFIFNCSLQIDSDSRQSPKGRKSVHHLGRPGPDRLADSAPKPGAPSRHCHWRNDVRAESSCRTDLPEASERS